MKAPLVTARLRHQPITPTEALSAYSRGIGTVITPKRFREIPSRWAKVVARQTGRDFGVIQSKVHGGFASGVWIKRPKRRSGWGLFMEMDAFSKPPDAFNGDRPSVAMTLRRLSMANHQTDVAHKYANLQERKWHNEIAETMAAREEWADEMATIVGRDDPVVALARSGMFPVASKDSEEAYAIKSNLPSGRVYSLPDPGSER